MFVYTRLRVLLHQRMEHLLVTKSKMLLTTLVPKSIKESVLYLILQIMKKFETGLYLDSRLS